jgi:hypothetical protein
MATFISNLSIRGLDVSKNIKPPCYCRESNHDTSVVQLLAKSLYRLRYPGALCMPTNLNNSIYGRRFSNNDQFQVCEQLQHCRVRTLVDLNHSSRYKR